MKFCKRARAICNLHSYYTRMHSFSANQKRVIGSCTLLALVNLSKTKNFTCPTGSCNFVVFEKFPRAY